MTESLDDKTYKLLFSVRRSVRYHDRRRRFYEVWNTVTVAAATIGGSAAVVGFLYEAAPDWLPAAISAFIAVVGAIDLSVGTARRADHHGSLARQFIAVEREFAHGRSLDDDEHERLVGERLRIEATEPTVLRLLDVLCHYELLRSLGDADKHPSVPWHRRLLAHWVSQPYYAQRVPERTAS